MNSVGLWGLIFVSFLALSGVAAQSGVITWADLRLNDEHSASLENGGADRSRLIVVSNDGRGDSLTVQGAIDLVPENNIQRVKIHIRPGVYRFLYNSLSLSNFFGFSFFLFEFFLGRQNLIVHACSCCVSFLLVVGTAIFSGVVRRLHTKCW